MNVQAQNQMLGELLSEILNCATHSAWSGYATARSLGVSSLGRYYRPGCQEYYKYSEEELDNMYPQRRWNVNQLCLKSSLILDNLSYLINFTIKIVCEQNTYYIPDFIDFDDNVFVSFEVIDWVSAGGCTKPIHFENIHSEKQAELFYLFQGYYEKIKDLIRWNGKMQNYQSVQAQRFLHSLITHNK